MNGEKNITINLTGLSTKIEQQQEEKGTCRICNGNHYVRINTTAIVNCPKCVDTKHFGRHF